MFGGGEHRVQRESLLPPEALHVQSANIAFQSMYLPHVVLHCPLRKLPSWASVIVVASLDNTQSRGCGKVCVMLTIITYACCLFYPSPSAHVMLPSCSTSVVAVQHMFCLPECLCVIYT